MPRLIDANEIIKFDHQHYDYMSDEFYVLVRDIENAPTVDAVEVVRCKDCKWSVSLDGILGCRWHGFYETGSDWFCADAERREDE